MSSESCSYDITFFISEDWYFCSHRLPIAQEIIKRGGRVTLITRVDKCEEEIKKEGIRLISLRKFKRRLQSPLIEFLSILECIRIYKRESSQIVHQVALKTIIYGTIAARIAGAKSIVNAFAGMGSLFTTDTSKHTSLQGIVMLFLRILFKSQKVHLIFQNEHDLKLFVKHRVIKKKQAILIRGSGVNLKSYCTEPVPAGLPVVLLPSRMLRDKGVGEFVEAAKLVNDKNKKARFVLVGAPDPENPSSIKSSIISKWVDSGWVEWWGYQTDMPDVYSKSQIVCLPSYREGLPKVLLEAAASCRAVITTDTVGCHDIVKHGVNGLLIPPRDATALAVAILYLLTHPEESYRMGLNGRDMVENGFTLEKTIEDTLSLYKSLLLQQS
jgi:glycosyltransferase involved in cell wall biosynthesis